jgi:hypothetical protein
MESPVRVPRRGAATVAATTVASVATGKPWRTLGRRRRVHDPAISVFSFWLSYLPWPCSIRIAKPAGV